MLVSESFHLHLQYKQRQVSIYSEVTEASPGPASCSPALSAHTAVGTIVVAEANSYHTYHHQLRQTSRESL